MVLVASACNFFARASNISDLLEGTAGGRYGSGVYTRGGSAPRGGTTIAIAGQRGGCPESLFDQPFNPCLKCHATSVSQVV